MSKFELRDGRSLELLDNHTESEKAVLFHHGTPGSSHIWQSWIEAPDLASLRTFAASRPGYGVSDRLIGRRVVDVVDDLSQVLDAYGIKSFVSVGWSGGGPHALAMSLDPRCAGVVTLAGVGQFGQSDLDFLAEMGPENIEEFDVALQGEGMLGDWMTLNAEAMRQVTGAELREAFGGLIGPSDKAVLEGKFADQMAATMRSALEKGFTGWIDDDLAFVHDWGFDLGGINIPVEIWQGDEDLMVPHSHSNWLASKIPSSHVTFAPKTGHISLIVNNRSQIVMQLKQLVA